MASSTSATWKAMPSSAARARWPAVVPRVSPAMVPRAYWSQCGAPKPGKRRHEIHAAAIRHAGRQRFDFRRGLDQPQSVAQPLHDRAGDEHAPLQRVFRPAAGIFQATVVSNSWREAAGFWPMFISMKQPVP